MLLYKKLLFMTFGTTLVLLNVRLGTIPLILFSNDRSLGAYIVGAVDCFTKEAIKSNMSENKNSVRVFSRYNITSVEPFVLSIVSNSCRLRTLCCPRIWDPFTH